MNPNDPGPRQNPPKSHESKTNPPQISGSNLQPTSQKPPRHFNSNHNPRPTIKCKETKNQKRLDSNGRQSWFQALEAIEWSTPERQTPPQIPPKQKLPTKISPKIRKKHHRKLPKPSQSLETGWNPKSDTLLFFLTISSSWSWHGRRCWCSSTYDYGLGMGELIHFPRQSSHECIIKSNNTPNALFKVTPLSYDQIFTQGECRWSMVQPSDQWNV